MPAKQIHEFETAGGLDVKFEHERATGPDSAEFRVWTEDDREWQVEVTEDDLRVLSSRREDQPADLGKPEWLQDWAARIRTTNQ